MFSSVRSTKARSGWSCFGKIIKVNYVIYRSSLYLKTLHLLVHNIIQRPRDVKQYNHCSQLLQLIPQLLAKISSSPSHKNFFSLDHTNIRSQICLLTQTLTLRLNKRACIQPAATYLRHRLQNQQGGVIIMFHSRGGVLPPPPPATPRPAQPNAVM